MKYLKSFLTAIWNWLTADDTLVDISIEYKPQDDVVPVEELDTQFVDDLDEGYVSVIPLVPAEVPIHSLSLENQCQYFEHVRQVFQTNPQWLEAFSNRLFDTVVPRIDQYIFQCFMSNISPHQCAYYIMHKFPLVDNTGGV